MRHIKYHQVNAVSSELVVVACDYPGPLGQSHCYEVFPKPQCDTWPLARSGKTCVHKIYFQNGSVEGTGWNGLTNEVLLGIVADRLESVQRGVYGCRAYGDALKSVQRALKCLTDIPFRS